LGGYPPGTTGKRSTTEAAILKTTLKKPSTGFYVFIRGLRFGRSLSGVIVNCKLHETFPILTVAGLIFKLFTKEQSQYVTIGLFCFVFHYLILKITF
jgi:hypothetical protein